MLRWLHISDLHFNDNDMSTVSLREELPNFLKRNNIRCDYVFCTGDIRTANATPNDFPDEAKRYLVQLCEAVGITTDRLFIVPGNHDVNRDAAGRHDAVKGYSIIVMDTMIQSMESLMRLTCRRYMWAKKIFGIF